MGSLWGHIDEGIAFVLLGFWWMYNVFKGYILRGGKECYQTEVSYEVTLRGRTFNFEVYAKIFVAIGGFLIECFNNGVPVTFVDTNGNFFRVTSLQHMSIYSLFIVHGVIDLLRYKKLLIIESLEYLTLSFAFAWYGFVFYFHVQHGADLLETIVHSLGMVWCFGAACIIVWECRTVDKFLPNYCRSLMVICLGTWFFHTPFYLYSTSDFPGQAANPLWDRNDTRNAQFIATMFGFHLFFNLLISLVMYFLMRLIWSKKKLRGMEDVAFQSLPQSETDEEEKARLLEDVKTEDQM